MKNYRILQTWAVSVSFRLKKSASLRINYRFIFVITLFFFFFWVRSGTAFDCNLLIINKNKIDEGEKL